MGIDLYPLGNHKIRFKDRHFTELATEIKTVLDNSTFPNAEFLRLIALDWSSYSPRRIRKIKEKQYWTFQEQDEYNNFNNLKRIEFEGPFGINLTFEENKITFWYPPYKYSQWIEMEYDVYRDEWRKYMKHIINLFGGDRVVYLADNSHHLQEFIYYQGTFEEMENALLKKYGKSKKNFEDVADNSENSYLIDNFKSIDWSKNYSLESYLPEPNDKSSIDYDLKKYALKDNLKKLDFQDEVLLHKLINNKIHFYHLATVNGLLCIHSGQVGGQENLQITLDEYAPFTYDTLEEKIKKEGYGNQCDNSYTIKFNEQDYSQSWQNALSEFKIELLWNGLGRKSGSSNTVYESDDWFYTVDETLALKLLIDLAKKFKVTSKFEVYHNHYTKINNIEIKNEVLKYKR